MFTTRLCVSLVLCSRCWKWTTATWANLCHESSTGRKHSAPTNHEACVTELCAAAAKDDWLLLVSDYNAWSDTALARAAGLDGSVDDILDDCPLVPRP